MWRSVPVITGPVHGIHPHILVTLYQWMESQGRHWSDNNGQDPCNDKRQVGTNEIMVPCVCKWHQHQVNGWEGGTPQDQWGEITYISDTPWLTRLESGLQHVCISVLGKRTHYIVSSVTYGTTSSLLPVNTKKQPSDQVTKTTDFQSRSLKEQDLWMGLLRSLTNYPLWVLDWFVPGELIRVLLLYVYVCYMLLYVTCLWYVICLLYV